MISSIVVQKLYVKPIIVGSKSFAAQIPKPKRVRITQVLTVTNEIKMRAHDLVTAHNVLTETTSVSNVSS